MDRVHILYEKTGMADGMRQEALHPYLLTIAIPTYNRSDYLDLCLSTLCPQVRMHETEVELLVSNNCSADATADIVRKYLSLGYPITYLRNAKNVGPDRNFVQCYKMARGKYTLLLGDDDVLLDHSLDKLLSILRTDDYGIVFMNSYGFKGDFARERPSVSPMGHLVFDDKLAFVKKVAHFLTFMSAVVFNRTLTKEPEDWNPFFSSNLVQLAWTFSALFNGKKDVYISEYLLAARLYNSGDYGVSRVFGHNLDKIFDVFRNQGVDGKYFRAINRRLLVEHFPAMIALGRNNIIPLQHEKYFRSLFPLYRGYPYFWLCTVPVIILPARFVYFLFRKAEKLLRRRQLAPDAK